MGVRSLSLNRFPLLLVALGCWILVARADVVYLEGGLQYKGRIVKENRRQVVVDTAGGRVVIPREDVSRIVREESNRDRLRRELRALKGSEDSDAYYQLGLWAEEHDLPKGARHCFKQAIEADAFHRPSREALGHRYHQGRWYTPDDYRRVVEGLVQWEGRWVTAEEAELLEQGLVQDELGNWVSQADLERRRKEIRPRPAGQPRGQRDSAQPAGHKREQEVVARPQPRQLDPGEPRPEEDTTWYRDNQSTGPFASADTYESRYYKIKSNVRSEYAERYGKMMDRYYTRFRKVFREYLPSGEIPKSMIWIYADRQEFMGATGMGPGVGGFYNTGNKRVTGYHGMFGPNGTTRTVLAHEGTHQFEDVILSGSFGNCPIWILEGLAVFFESAYYDGEDVIIGLVPKDRLSALKRGIESNTLIPLTDLIRTPQPQFTGYHYAHAWGLIYMVLYYGESRSVRQRCQRWFSELMMESRTRRVSPELVEERCGGRDKFLELEEKWKEWIRDLPYDYDPKKG